MWGIKRRFSRRESAHGATCRTSRRILLCSDLKTRFSYLSYYNECKFMIYFSNLRIITGNRIIIRKYKDLYIVVLWRDCCLYIRLGRWLIWRYENVVVHVSCYSKNLSIKLIVFYYVLTSLSFLSGGGSRIPYSITYFLTGFSSKWIFDSLKSSSLLRPRTRATTNPAAADDRAIPTAPNSNLFSLKNDIAPA